MLCKLLRSPQTIRALISINTPFRTTSVLSKTLGLSTKGKMSSHFKCRGSDNYPRSSIQRQPVPDDKVLWTLEWSDYDPPELTQHDSKPWEDPPTIRPIISDDDSNRQWRGQFLDYDPEFQPKWNALDGVVDRRSHEKTPYSIREGYPLNPIGRTGLRGRGILGRWGPNHAADPVVTRWKRKEDGSVDINSETGKPVLQFVAIKRGDCGEWAIPGGMVDVGEKVSTTLKREFMEEAIDSLSLGPNDKQDLEAKLESTFSQGKEIYCGYVDDPRNTDNSWMETVAYNFHDETGDAVGRFPLNAGDDAVDVRWMDINKDLNLYASHTKFLKLVAKKHEAHW